MLSSTKRGLLKVFIGSPGDLTPEREVTRRVVDELNRSLGRQLNIHVDLLGWEDTTPGVGRPQSLINRDVEECDLFVGMLWKRWGTPSGEFSSGFEEEFEIARERNEKTGSPEIWLAFKGIEASLLADPGDQLKRVLAFKQAQIAARTVLFKEFNSEDEWASYLRSWLMNLIGMRVREELELSRSGLLDSGAADTPSSSPNTGGEVLGTNARIPFQLQATAGKFQNALGSGADSDYTDRMTDFDQFDTVRLFVAVKSWLSSRFTSEVLSTHEIQLLYLQRDQLELLPIELELVIRTLAADKSNTAAGWYWFRELSDEQTTDALLSLFRTDPLTEVRERSMEILRESNLQPSEQGKQELARSADEEADPTVLNSILDYVSSWDDPTYIDDLVRFTLRLDHVGFRARLALFRAKLRLNPSEAVGEEVQTILGLPNDIREELTIRISTLDVPTLERGISNSDPEIRYAAARALLQRDKLDSNIASILLKDGDIDVRSIAVQGLIKNGADITPDVIREALKTEQQGSLGFRKRQESLTVDKAVEQLFEKLSEQELKSRIDWFDLNGYLAYKVWAKKFFAQNRTIIREHLRNGFQEIRTASENRMRTQYGSLAEEIVEAWEKVNSYILSQFNAAALAALVQNGTSKDLPAVRKRLKGRKADARNELIESLRLIGRIGQEQDISTILAIARESHGLVRTEALQSALGIRPGINGVVPGLLDSDLPQFVYVGVASIVDQPPSDTYHLVYPLLHHQQIEIRSVAIGYLFEQFQRGTIDLEFVLQTYLQSPTYYYNVVTWLDRLLYAPVALRSYYARLLIAEGKRVSDQWKELS